MAASALAAAVIIAIAIAYPLRTRANFTLATVAGLIGIYIVEVLAEPRRLGLENEVYTWLAFAPAELASPEKLYTVLTTNFLHAVDWPLHLIFNIIALIFLGSMLEARIGALRTEVIYLIAGVGGTLIFALFAYASTPEGAIVIVIGASGAISGVLGAFGRLFPHERISLWLMFVPLPPMPAWLVVVGFLALQALALPSASSVAYAAHIGGALVGILVVPLVMRTGGLAEQRRLLREGLPRPPSSRTPLAALATTPELKEIFERIQGESVPEVRRAWLEHFAARARCRICKAELRIEPGALVCPNAHEFDTRA